MLSKPVLSKPLGIGLLLVVAMGASGVLWPELWRRMFSTQGFMPHGHCYLWRPEVVRLHVSSDLLIGLSYVAISATLAYLVHRARREIPFHWMILAFGLFIVACGGTHFMEVYTLWRPRYWLSGDIKLLTAAASVATAIALPPLVPKVLALIRDAKLSQERKRRLEAANAELEKLNARLTELDDLKTRFFANVSHELRTPLTLILGPTERMLASGEMKAEERQTLEVIERNARTLLKYVNDLLDISRLEAGKMTVHSQTVDLVKLLRVTAAHFQELAREQQVQLSVDAPEVALIRADPEKLQRVFLNLLSNAFKFTPPGGSVRCLLSLDRGSCVIEFQDSGPGVPASMREVIFERFQQANGSFTRRFGGTGLGLAIAKEFVELHRGKISAGDSPAGGALFRVELPLLATDAEAPGVVASIPDGGAGLARLALADLDSAARRPEAQSPSSSGRHLVLVVEDNADMNRFVRETLSGEYRVAGAFDGQEGLEKAIQVRPDVILTDLMMPGMSGDQLVREARAHPDLHAVPIIFLTARSDDELCAKLLKNGAQDYLRKPFCAEELRVRIRHVVSTHHVREVLRQELASRSENLAELAQELIVNKHELQRALAELRGSEARKSAIVETALDGILSFDHQGIIQEWNPSAETILGFTKTEMVGRKVDELILPESLREFSDRGLSAYLSGGAGSLLGRPLELTLKRKDSSEFRAELAITRNSCIDPALHTCFIRDITERKRAELEIRSLNEQLERRLVQRTA